MAYSKVFPDQLLLILGFYVATTTNFRGSQMLALKKCVQRNFTRDGRASPCDDGVLLSRSLEMKKGSARRPDPIAVRAEGHEAKNLCRAGYLCLLWRIPIRRGFGFPLGLGWTLELEGWGLLPPTQFLLSPREVRLPRFLSVILVRSHDQGARTPLTLEWPPSAPRSRGSRYGHDTGGAGDGAGKGAGNGEEATTKKQRRGGWRWRLCALEMT